MRITDRLDVLKVEKDWPPPEPGEVGRERSHLYEQVNRLTKDLKIRPKEIREYLH